MTWTAMESSALQAAAYAEGQALLYLLFRSGEVYRYFDVPQWQYQEFLAADSNCWSRNRVSAMGKYRRRAHGSLCRCGPTPGGSGRIQAGRSCQRICRAWNE
jgi:hypothetical protein